MRFQIKPMAEKISTLQQALDAVEVLEPEEQAILVDIINKRLSQQCRNDLLKEVAQARDDYQNGNIKRGSVADLMNVSL
jgi:tRNA A37 N6-isopentenylltransferase MiaA